MVSVTAYLHRITFQAFTNSPQVIKQVGFNGFIDEVFSVFRTEYLDVCRLWIRTVAWLYFWLRLTPFGAVYLLVSCVNADAPLGLIT